MAEYNNTKKDVNTSGYQLYPNMRVAGPKSTLIIGHWKDLLTIKLCPELPENLQNEKSKFNYKEYLQVVLKPNKSLELLKAIEKFKENPSTSYGVQTGENLIMISATPEQNVVLSIFTKIDETGKPENELTFVFNTAMLIEGYNPQTGEYDIGSGFMPDLDLLMLTLEESCKAHTNAQVHANRNVNKFNTDKVNGNLEAIALKLGVEPIGAKREGGYNKSESSYFNAGGNSRPTQEDIGSVENGGYIEGRLSI